MQAKKLKFGLNNAILAAKAGNSEARPARVAQKNRVENNLPDIPELEQSSMEDTSDSVSQVSDNQTTLSIKNKTILEDVGSFPEFSSLITHTYWGSMTKNSTTLDIIAVYLKGQKILYIDSKNHCEEKYNYLMMPTIFITAVCSIISMVLKDYEFGAIIVSALAGISAFILSVINFLGLDSKAQAHKTSAYQFDKLQTMCEFFSGKVLLIKDDNVDKKVQDFVTQVEKKIEEIKDVNQFIIPEAIRYRYPKIYSVNVFSEIKRYKNREKILRNELYNICQKIDKLRELEQTIPEEIITAKEMKLRQVLEHQNEYFKLDDEFDEEVNTYVNSQVNKKGCCSCKRQPKTSTPISPNRIPKVPIVVIPPEL